MRRRLASFFGSFALLAVACSGGAPEPGAPGVAAGRAAPFADVGASSAGADAAPAPKPVTGSPTEATRLIGEAIDKNAAEMRKCISDYRARKKMPHERVEIAVGIDQEGRLLGATLKGRKQDTLLSDCLQRALASAPFPRSHAGVIQVTKSYEEIEQ